MGEPKTHKSVQYVGYSEAGWRVGESHQNAKLTEEQVEAIRDLYEAHEPGHPLHIGYKKLSAIYGVPRRTIRDIVNFNRRNQWPAKWKKLKREEPHAP